MADPKHLLLPEDSRLLHIGPQKTGSTAIQAAMHERRDQLREFGVVYPGPSMRPAEAASVGLGLARPRGAPPARRAAWEDLLRQLDEARGLRVCLSHEAFGRATHLQAERIVGEFGGDKPHVLAVARRYDRLLPSQWQQRVKAGETLSYEDWVCKTLDAALLPPVRGSIWLAHDTRQLVERWAGLVGYENFTLVVADENNHGFLPRTIESMLGLPEGMLDPVAGQTNRSLSLPEVELVRRLNILFRGKGWSDRDYFHLVYRGVIRNLVRSPMPPSDSPIPPLPAWAVDRVAELSRQRVEALAKLAELGVRVVGGLDGLAFDPGEAPTAEVTARADQVSVDTALRSLEGMALGARWMRRELRVEHRAKLQNARRHIRRQARKAATPAVQGGLPRRMRRRAGSALGRMRSRG